MDVCHGLGRYMCVQRVAADVSLDDIMRRMAADKKDAYSFVRIYSGLKRDKVYMLVVYAVHESDILMNNSDFVRNVIQISGIDESDIIVQDY